MMEEMLPPALVPPTMKPALGSAPKEEAFCAAWGIVSLVCLGFG